ncbi:MAG: response regulator [Candidatus Paceibacterota bacterium]|jgi:CheY-like chemotaxis protein
MKEKLVFVVEDDPMMSRLLSSMLRANGASFIIAHNIEDALSLFRANKDNITHVLLDGSLTPIKIGTPFPKEPETLPLAKEIAETEGFHGLVYPMSILPDYTSILLKELGNKGVFLGTDCTKVDAVKVIIDQIKQK